MSASSSALFDDSTPDSPGRAGDVREYHLAPAVRARLVGVFLVLLSLLVFAGSIVAVLLRLSLDVVVVLTLVLLVSGGIATWLAGRIVVLRTDPAGYRVSLVRGAGVTRGRWVDVTELAESDRGGDVCAVLRLADGRTTTLPLGALDAPSVAVLNDLAARLESVPRR